jgi:hypothetical protein
MKKLLLLFTLLSSVSYLSAQSLPASGFYRIKNVKSGRYVTVVDSYGKLDITGAKADLGALRTFPDYNKIVYNPGAVVYMLYEREDHYDMQGQGTGARAIVGYPLQVHPNADGTFWAYASKSSAALYLKEVFDDFSDFSQFGPYGKLITSNLTSTTDNSFKFNIIPLSASNDDNYFGIKPDINVGSSWYKSFYMGFAYTMASPGMNTYYVTKVDKAKGVAVYEEIKGTVPKQTPAFVKCSSQDPSANRLDFTFNSPAAVSGNILTGVFFCNTPVEAAGPDHEMYVQYNESTMRVLGKTSSGELGYIKAPDSAVFIENGKKYIPSNTAYLTVDASTPAELKLVTKEEYEASSSVTVTAKSYTITYGDPIPSFEYDASASLSGTPSLTCQATSASPVGTYPIVVGQGSVTGATVNGINGTLTINPAPLTVTAQAATRVYGDANPTLNVTYSGWKNGENESVLTTKASATCAANATSDAGQYDITVAGAAAQNYTFTYVPAKLTVTQAPVAVTAKSYEIKQTDALPNYEATYSGWKNGQDESVLTKKPTFTCNVPDNKPAGTYDIVVSGAEAKNYTFTYTSGKLTITAAAAITVRAEAKTMTYGDAVPQLTYTVEGGTLTGTPVLSTTASSTSDVGEYDITIAKGDITYPNVVLVGAKLTVTPATVAVTAKSYTMVETDALPTFEATYSGWKNGQDESVLTKQPTFSCNVTDAKTPGTYDINVSGAEAKNYTLTYTPGKLTITEAPTITIKADAKQMTYGDAVPELTYTVEGGKLEGKPVLSTTASSTSAVGEYDITIAKGDIVYPRLVLEGAKLTVNKATVTVNAGTYTMKQNEQRPAFKATYSGWKNSDTEAVLTKQPTLTTNAPNDNAPGEYTVTASGAEANNYNFSYVVGKLIITAADAITIMATDATMVYGDAVPELKYTVTGGTVTGTPVLTCEAKSTSDVGEYVIKVEKGDIDYANLVLVNGTLTITKAELTVKAEDAEREEGKPNPEFTLTYSGWKNSDTEAVLITKPVATTEADEASTPGTYPITVSGGEAKNYTFKYVNGTLTVIKEDAIAAIIAQGKTFDVYTVSGVKVRSRVTTLQGLPAGIYMINGKKYLVK